MGIYIDLTDDQSANNAFVAQSTAASDWTFHILIKTVKIGPDFTLLPVMSSSDGNDICARSKKKTLFFPGLPRCGLSYS